MAEGIIPDLIKQVDPVRLSHDLVHLSENPLPCRTLNYSRPGQAKATLDEADDFIQERLDSQKYMVTKESSPVRCFRRDESGPKPKQHGRPHPGDKLHVAHNIYAIKQGITYPNDYVLLLAHKDSQSWLMDTSPLEDGSLPDLASPGAYDNAVGTVALMEIARILKDYESRHSFKFLFCNEEHVPWTSNTAARNARIRGDKLTAIINVDSLGGKSQEDIDAGKKTNTILYTKPEGKPFADLVERVNQEYEIGLVQQIKQKDRPNDDDGSFIKEDYSHAIMCLGSFPYKDPNYHLETDTPDKVDIDNVAMVTQAILAAALKVDLG